MSLYPVESGTINRAGRSLLRDILSDSIVFYYYHIPPSNGPPIIRGYVEYNIEALWNTIASKLEFRYEGKANPVTDTCYIYSMETQPSLSPNSTVFNDAGDGTPYLDNDAVFPDVGTLKDVGGASGPVWDTDPLSDLQAAIDARRSWFALGFRNSETTLNDEGSFYSERKPGVAPFPTLYVEYTVPGPPLPEPPPVDPEYAAEHPEYVSPPAPTKNLTSNKHVATPYLPYRITMRSNRGRVLRHVTRRVRG